MARYCYIVVLKPNGDLIVISLDLNNPKKIIYIGASLASPLKEELVKFLQDNKDVFAWKVVDMSETDPQLTTHKLNVSSDRALMKHKKRSFAPERREARGYKTGS